MDSPTARPTNVRWLVFGLGCGTSLLLYLHRYTFALIKPELKQQGIGEEQLGLLDSAFSLCYTVFQFPAGVAADVTGVHLFLGGIILLWSVALGLHATSRTVLQFGFARALLGTGQAGAFAAVSRMTRTWFPFSVRTSVQGWMGVFSGRIGGLAANLVFATVLMGFLGLRWQTAIFWFAGLGIAHGVVFLLLFRDSPAKHPLANAAEAELIADGRAAEPGAGADARPRLALGAMFSRMSPRSLGNLAYLNLASMMSTVADNIYSNWIPLFLADVHGLKFKEMGIYSALPLLGGACGGAAGGMINDLAIRRSGNRRWARSLVGFGGKGIAGVLLLTALATCYDHPRLFCVMLFVVKFFADCELATRWGTVTDIGGNATASVFAFNNSVAGIGAVLAPAMYGFVAGGLGWWPVFLIAAGAYFLCATGWLAVNCTVPVVREEDPERRS